MAVRIADTLGTMGEGGYALVNAANVWLADKTTVEAAIANIKSSVSGLFDVTANISYNTVDTYAKLQAVDTTAFESGVYIYIVKQDENYPKDDDEDYSTLYIWITSAETPAWNFIGKLNVSEKMMEEMITSSITTALSSYYTKTEVDAKIATAGGSYTLPTASADTLGGIKVGSNLSIDADGKLNAEAGGATYSEATTSVAGLMSASDKTKLNGIATGANNYSLPTASSSTLGGVKVGTNLSISNGVLSATDTTYSDATTSTHGLMSTTDKTKLDAVEEAANNYSLPIASAATLGGIKVGANLSIAEDGTLNATGGGSGSGSDYELPIASESTLGGIKIGDNLSIDDDGVVSASAPETPEVSVGTSAPSAADGYKLWVDTEHTAISDGDVVMCKYDEYSTDEIVIGKWVDGRPVYRKKYDLDMPSSADKSTTYNLDVVMDAIISFKAICWTSGGIVGISGNDGVSGPNVTCFARNNNHATDPNTVEIKLGSTFYNSYFTSSLMLIIEYTKTTDAENSFDVSMLDGAIADDTATDDEVEEVFG